MPRRTYGLIGKSLSHSFSKDYFTQKFDSLNLPHKYFNFELNSIHEIMDLIETQKDLRGLNVTIPFKESIIPHLDEIDPIAAQIGAVNTVSITEGKLKGFNTDAFGFKQLIKPFFKGHHERALILGSGGASKAVRFVLENLGVECNTVSRNPDTTQLNYNQLNNHVLNAHLLIVNTTPLGMFPTINACPNIPYDLLTERHLLIDLIYNPSKTAFMQKGELRNATVINGTTMLHQQAERSWSIWQ
ncbi:MAG: shikimate dehydrogenase [Crocinitomicaceae bacterium]|jgi:shikimate dehydrogenase|nr:shikimate dehydrogenase [Crocinitomicaceae bacterium]MBT6030345.1 shikimate dehydrogenase [Crocinitomicaceae bacterium]MBT6516024.1 shikimate dehydrogenase [Crocinitomicaceae bacterium]